MTGHSATIAAGQGHFVGPSFETVQAVRRSVALVVSALVMAAAIGLTIELQLGLGIGSPDVSATARPAQPAFVPAPVSTEVTPVRPQPLPGF